MKRAVHSAVACVVAISQLRADAGEPTPSPSPALFARCEAESRSRFGTSPIYGAHLKGGPKRVRDSKLVLPELPHGTRGSGRAIHEILIGPDGRVQAVWPVQEPVLEPPFPAVSQAIVDELRSWEYEPYRMGGKALPVCVAVTTNIHWR
jgi:hypothetical protein